MKWYNQLKVNDKIVLIKEILYDNQAHNIYDIVMIQSLQLNATYTIKVVESDGIYISIDNKFENWTFVDVKLSYSIISKYFEPELKTKLNILANEI